ncbi:glutamate--tRNA ligase [Hyphomicrobium sulfonivorans]|uniref:glutamate--tRNA ligase n=1 Tax=Hyphomicrobium sulfonivorans TaxID=121290 RepID=UPI00156FDCCB|nr:glutamate--tRNA ligase [Hyphomicrobium sulfonivorans]MBI1650396.1 glutamate--tRNA ligase [Hyphomicrobium sulfonivorans]NSL72243.1 glutamate--tRNA ligase [Hyphomicrobium sulfonivorans]
MSVKVRFAPSPTGRLHVGNVRTALLNWLFARNSGGTFMLRMDDTDLQRSTAEFADGIRVDLNWLGLRWDEEKRQSDRTDRYAAAAEALKAQGRLYACYETEDELDRKRKRQRARGMPPIYDRAGLKITPEERATLEAEGRRPHWRFRLDNSENGSLTPLPTIVSWNDLIRGDQTVDVGSLSDPVVIRADGSFLYTFTSVIDDAEFGITHIIRGEDHVTNTGVQLQLFEALGAVPPAFGHHSLLVGADGAALSKRLGALSIESLREDGIEPMAVSSYTALIGTSDAIEAVADIDDLAARFAFSKISTAPARFDPEELKSLNARLLHATPYDEVAAQLADLGVGGDAAFWLAVRGNISVLADAAIWWRVVADRVDPVIEDRELTDIAAGLLPAEPWCDTTWDDWIAKVKAASGRKGRGLFHPLRMALTGRNDGPELKALLPLIGRARAEARLRGQQA